jgi:5S rRNA maturation endonuclease (ribonuclease M5)
MELADKVRELVESMDRDVDAVKVEGGHDREALERAGFSGRIYVCSGNRGSLSSLAQAVKDDRVTVSILTDFDEEGRKICGKLRDSIPERRTRRVWRRKLGKMLTRKGRRDIESINNLLNG